MADNDQHQFKDRYMLRLPDGMRDRIKAAAEANNRSMNAEIVAALEKAFPPATTTTDLLSEYHSLSSSLLREGISDAERQAIKRTMDGLYEELIRRRDADYPFGPLNANGKPEPKNIRLAFRNANKRLAQFCDDMDAGRDEAKEQMAEYLASLARGLLESR